MAIASIVQLSARTTSIFHKACTVLILTSQQSFQNGTLALEFYVPIAYWCPDYWHTHTHIHTQETTNQPSAMVIDIQLTTQLLLTRPMDNSIMASHDTKTQCSQHQPGLLGLWIF